MNGDPSPIPPRLRWALEVVNRVGFPILAFLLIFWLSQTSMKEMSKSLEQIVSDLKLTNEKLATQLSAIKDEIKQLDLPRKGDRRRW